MHYHFIAPGKRLLLVPQKLISETKKYKLYLLAYYLKKCLYSRAERHHKNGRIGAARSLPVHAGTWQSRHRGGAKKDRPEL